jgi:N-acetylglucosamine-6-sulfatase
MRRLLVASLVAFCALAFVPATAPVASSSTQPNIVFIVTDDQRMDMFQFMPTVQSQLIAKGTSFSHAYAGNPLCCPARTSILRGQYAHYTRLYGVSGTYGGAFKYRKFGLDKENLAVWLDRVGYRTAMVGKYLNGYTGSDALSRPVPAGWDYWRSWLTGDAGYFDFSVAEGTQGVVPIKKSYSGTTSAAYSNNVYTNYATEFINATPSTEPMFLSLDYHAPHAPHTPDPADATEPCGAYPNDPSLAETDVSDKPNWVQSKTWTTTNTKQVKNAWVQSCRQLLSVDRGVSAVLAALEARDPGLTNTIIIYTTDQGLMLGSHRLQGKKAAYEESAQVPFIVRWDRTVPAGVASPRLVTHIDMAATAVALAGATAPNPEPCLSPCILGPIEGQNLVPLLLDPATPWRTDLLIEAYDAPGTNGYVPPYCAVVNDARMKYIRYDPDDERRYEELYNLNSDPYELQNLAYDPAYAATKAALNARLQQLCSPTPVNYGF